MAWQGGAVSVVCLILAACVSAVDRSNFKTCDQSSFCRRNRAVQSGQSPYTIDSGSLTILESGCQMDVVDQKRGVVLRAKLSALAGNGFRVQIDEKSPMRPRYKVDGALVGDPELQKCQVQRSSSGVEVTTATSKVSVTFDPFRMDFHVNNEIAVVLNSRGLFNFEHYRTRERVVASNDGESNDGDGDLRPIVGGEEGGANVEEGGEVTEEERNEGGEEEEVEPVTEEPDMWEESFKSHKDSKPYGPSSVAMDISFPGVEHVYGIPEHADSLALKPTDGGDPYRLYNLDVFEYELDNKMALYGSIPIMLAHNWSKTVGVFWHNAAETWIDITNSAANKSMLGKLLSYFKSDEEVPQIDTHWMSESGVIDIFVLLGPRPHDVFYQYAQLTGFPTLPPLFAIAYHQSRWNYNDQEDVQSVDEGFDEHDIPYDVLWLDIEHTDGKKYLTWDSGKFPHPEAMQDNLARKGRKMVTIVDPHIKRDGGYHIHTDAESLDLYVKKSDGNSNYEGHCWPGSSSWIDFVNPEARQWWADQFAVDKYKGSTLNLFTWNDMNEPSVFNGPEISMHKDARHHGGWEHRDVHNIYGMFQHQATAEGQVQRSGGKERSFVLSRAFFAGSQRFGAIWTGDNEASWEHLKMSVPMVLSVSVAGLPFVGADVGGFFKNPDPDLLVRWYQAGAFYPFFRAHAHMDTRRREPWLFDADKMALIREAVRTRYQLLPFWYTTFYEAWQTGMPVVRPVWMEFPRDKNTYAMEDQLMVGGALMVRPVTDQYASTAQLYLPGANTIWYDTDDYSIYSGGSRYIVDTPLSKVPVFQRGGTIVPKKMRVRRASSLTANDPYTLVVALDAKGDAQGQLYIDDGHSLQYKSGDYLRRTLVYSDGRLTSSASEASGSFATRSWLERVVVVGIHSRPSSVRISGEDLMFTYEAVSHLLTIRRPGVNMGHDFTITIH